MRVLRGTPLGTALDRILVRLGSGRRLGMRDSHRLRLGILLCASESGRAFAVEISMIAFFTLIIGCGVGIAIGFCCGRDSARNEVR